MTEFKFPDPQKIDWAGLKESDVVWIKATVEQAIIKQSGGAV